MSDERGTHKATRVAAWVLLVALLYVVVAGVVYAFRHPEQTDVQRFLNLGDALLWR